MELFGTSKINKKHELTIGGVSAVDLVKKHKTPLYVMDETLMRNQCQTFLKQFQHPKLTTNVIYASKAFLNIAMAKLIAEEGLMLEVVSGGELYTAIAAKFPMSKVLFHGNNKSKEELMMAFKNKVGVIVIDHAAEFELIASILPKNIRLNVMLRVNPGIEAHTHEYIKTTKNDSKFGVSIFDRNTFDLIKKIAAHKQINFLGFHSHIGSQIFEAKSFLDHGLTLLEFVNSVKDKLKIEVTHLNMGGGFGVKYTDEDKPLLNNAFLKNILNEMYQFMIKHNLKPLTLYIEPGRAIVANAGTTLYTVGSTKTTFGGKRYVFVDGSIADHIRTVLYQAKYQAALANKMQLKATSTFTVSGKACESGDIIIREAKLPEPVPNDILAVFTTGAYHYTMSSNYNRLPRPAVVFVKNGKSRVVVKRETYQDLIRNDIGGGK
jgi:diaminopimelate decarboxylase